MLYCPNCVCTSCTTANNKVRAQMQRALANPPTRNPYYATFAVKKTITCGWCHEEHNTFEDIQWCRRTIDARMRTSFEEAAVAAWELLEELRPSSSESDRSSDPQ